MDRGIVLHCSDSPSATVAEIDDWHRARGFLRSGHWARSELKHIGYHFVITNGRGGPDGQVHRGREVGETGAHAKGLNHWIGICLVGRSTFTRAQMLAAHLLVLELRAKFSIPTERVIGHFETPLEQDSPKPKTCPNFDVGAFRHFQRAVDATGNRKMG